MLSLTLNPPTEMYELMDAFFLRKLTSDASLTFNAHSPAVFPLGIRYRLLILGFKFNWERPGSCVPEGRQESLHLDDSCYHVPHSVGDR